jgi:hypothetical protein
LGKAKRRGTKGNKTLFLPLAILWKKTPLRGQKTLFFYFAFGKKKGNQKQSFAFGKTKEEIFFSLKKQSFFKK